MGDIILKGILIGIASITPGVSGGVIAVILNVYDKLLLSIKDIKHNYIFLIKTITGIIIGIILTSILLNKIYDKYYIETSFLFIGFIVGTIPFLIKNHKEKTNKNINVILLMSSIIISLIINITLSNIELYNYKYFVSGILYSIGKIVPGLSSTAFLINVGTYNYFLDIISNPINILLNDTIHLVELLFGVLVGIILSYKLIIYLLNKHYEYINTFVIGFVISSTLSIYPNGVTITGIIMLLVGLLVSYFLQKL